MGGERVVGSSLTGLFPGDTRRQQASWLLTEYGNPRQVRADSSRGVCKLSLYRWLYPFGVLG